MKNSVGEAVAPHCIRCARKIATVVDERVAIVAIGNVALVATAGNKSFAGNMQWRDCRSQND